MHWVPVLNAAADYRDVGLAPHPTPFAPAPGSRSSTWWDRRGSIEVLSLDDHAAAAAMRTAGIDADTAEAVTTVRLRGRGAPKVAIAGLHLGPATGTG